MLNLSQTSLTSARDFCKLHPTENAQTEFFQIGHANVSSSARSLMTVSRTIRRMALVAEPGVVRSPRSVRAQGAGHVSLVVLHSASVALRAGSEEDRPNLAQLRRCLLHQALATVGQGHAACFD